MLRAPSPRPNRPPVRLSRNLGTTPPGCGSADTTGRDGAADDLPAVRPLLQFVQRRCNALPLDVPPYDVLLTTHSRGARGRLAAFVARAATPRAHPMTHPHPRCASPRRQACA